MFKFLPFSLLLILGSIDTSAQNREIDSLQLLLTATTSETTKIDIYRNLCEEYTYINADTSLYYGQLSYELSKKNNLKKQEVLALFSIGIMHFGQGRFIECKEFFAQSLEISKTLKDTSLMAKTSNALGGAYWRLDENTKALQSYQHAHDYALISNNEVMYQTIIGNMGIINNNLGRSEVALKYYDEAIAISRAKNNKKGEAIHLTNKATCLLGIEKYDLALESYQKALEMTTVSENPILVAQTYSYIAYIFSEQNKKAEALSIVEKGITICNKFSLNANLVNCLDEKTGILLGLDRYLEAIVTSKEGIKLAESLGIKDATPSFYKALSIAYEKQGEANEALNWERKYSESKDSLFESNSQKEIAQLEISFQSKQKDIENLLLKKEKESQNLVIQQRTRIAISVSLSMILLSIIALQLFLARRKTKEMNTELEEEVKRRTKELEEMNKQLLQSNSELEQFNYILSHDLKEPLRSIVGFCTLIKNQVKPDHKIQEYLQYIENGGKQLYQLIEDVYSFHQIDKIDINEITALDLNELLKSIESSLSPLLAQKKGKIEYSNLPIIQSNTAVLLMALKNTIENGIKYNDKEFAKITLSYKRADLQHIFLIEDNGIGIDIKFQSKIIGMFKRLNDRSKYSGTGLGLSLVKKCLQKIDGHISLISSTIGEGSIFEIRIPVVEVNNPVDLKAEILGSV